MATKRFRNGAWRYTVRNKTILPKPIYLTFKDESEGDQYVYKLESLLAKGIIPDGFLKKDSKSLGKIIEAYQEFNHIKEDDEKLLNLIHADNHKLPIADLDFHWAETWIKTLKREKNLAPGTIRHYAGALARCLDWALAKEFIKSNPLRQLPRGYAQYTAEDGRHVDTKQDQERDRRLEDGEEAKIREVLAVEPDIQLYFEIALETAMRLSEIYTLELSQVDIKNRTIFLDKTKNGQKRQVPMTSKMVETFTGRESYPSHPKSKTTTSRISKQFARLVEPVASGFRFHDLRHEATSRFFEKTTLSPFEIRKITGHSSDRMLARYANLRASNLSDRLW